MGWGFGTSDKMENDPSWMDSENDEGHREEVEPLLFGKGNLDLTDPDETDSPKKGSKTNSPKGYGSTESNSPKAPKQSFWTLDTPATSDPPPPTDEDSEPEHWADEKEGGSPKKGGSSGEDWANEDDDDVENGDDSPVMDEATFNEQTGRPRRPTRHCCLRMFNAIGTYAMITNLALLISQLLPLITIPWEENDLSYLVLKVYLCVFAIILFFVEVDHPAIPFLKKASFLRTFATRGFLYTFFGLVCFNEADSEKAYNALRAQNEDLLSLFQVSWYALFNQLAAWSLISVGILYFLLGILCMQPVRNRYAYHDRQKWKAYREALEKWKQGL